MSNNCGDGRSGIELLIALIGLSQKAAAKLPGVLDSLSGDRCIDEDCSKCTKLLECPLNPKIVGFGENSDN
jgi:hypothetical protein